MAVNAMLVYDYGNNSLRRAKTDKKDAIKLANTATLSTRRRRLLSTPPPAAITPEPTPDSGQEPVGKLSSYADDIDGAEYEPNSTKQDVLEKFGFPEDEPYYVYYDPESNQKELELYFDPDAKIGCGFFYNPYYEDGKDHIQGFGFHSVADDSFYRPLRGTMSEGPAPVYQDGKEVFQHDSISHGWLGYYYIYDNNGSRPKYCLKLDHDLGTFCYPTMYNGSVVLLAEDVEAARQVAVKHCAEHGIEWIRMEGIDAEDGIICFGVICADTPHHPQAFDQYIDLAYLDGTWTVVSEG